MFNSRQVKLFLWHLTTRSLIDIEFSMLEKKLAFIFVDDLG